MSIGNVSVKLDLGSDGSHDIPAGQSREIVAMTPQGQTVVEVELKESPFASAQGVQGWWNVVIRNWGGHGMLSVPDQTVVIKSLAVQIEDSRVSEQGFKAFNRYDAKDGHHAYVGIDGSVYGIRDGALREPTAVAWRQGVVVCTLIDDRPATFGYPTKTESWRGGDGDQRTQTDHVLEGGGAYLWDVLVCDENFVIYFDVDPEPDTATKDEWRRLARVADEDNLFLLPPFHQRIIQSLERVGIKEPPPRFEDDPGSAGFLLHMLQGPGRYMPPRDWSYEHFDVPGPPHQHLYWKSWPQMWWGSGIYNQQYLWTLHFFRLYLLTGRLFFWSWFNRLARLELTTARCWTDATKVGGSWRQDHSKLGWRHYEKSHHQGKDGVKDYTRVGRQHHPSPYKEPAESLCAALVAYKDHSFANHARRISIYAIINEYGYDQYDGKWGSRTPGWGMMNGVAIWRYLGDQSALDMAVRTADNVLNVMKRPTIMAQEHNPKWKDASLGIPYVPNDAANPRGYTNLFGHIKMCEGFIHLYTLAKKKEYKPKIHHMTTWMMEECMTEHAGMIFVRHPFTPDRVPAYYNNGHGKVNIPDRTEWTRSFAALPIAFMAAKGHQQAIDILGKLYNQIGAFLFHDVPLQETYWQGVTAPRGGQTVGGDFEGVQPGRHFLRMKSLDRNDQELSVRIGEIKSATKTSVTLNQADANWLNDQLKVEYFVCGPIINNVKSDRDKAVRGVKVLPFSVDHNKPFDWMAGRHYSNWSKMAAATLMNWDFVARAYWHLKNIGHLK